MKNHRKRRKQLQCQLANANSYEQWFDAAEKLDEMDGLLAWREDGDTGMLHSDLIREHIRQMAHYRQEGDTVNLPRVLQESLYRHLGELSNPDLYGVARTGTKLLVTEFLQEVERSMRFVCDQPMPGVSAEQKLQLFHRAERVFGRPALMLSGGAAFGIYHLGVTRALWQRDLLPDVVAGSSMGAIIAASICCRNDTELAAFFEKPHQVHLDALRWLRLDRMVQQGHAMDQTQLHEHIRSNVGSMSFREAYLHSGRTLNISVSPTRTRQKPRLLNELASPDVLIDYAVLASCAVPGIFPSVTLKSRNKKTGGNPEIPYMPTEHWIDGSVQGDLPMMRLARLHNVNKTIVSQANPHVLPFITHHHERGPKAALKQAAASVLHAQVATVLELTRDSWNSSLLRPYLQQAHAMATQAYLGDINIQFPFSPLLYRKVLSNPSPEDLEMYIRLGEQATWPRMALIHDQTLISRTFTDCIRQLTAQVETGQLKA
ncbi:MAG: phospholipase [Alteromonadaceae bacterium]|uniref:patatin-like phospholipase family protein n=1 Tax=unclassified Marinobacter TaxID=83889 RepID=UPI000C3B65FE|nr:patatin-like phospholipase family protein [Marinobacter sp. BGYM27]MAA65138.1 phospholipase [Alteromonadaceae bacterium]MBH85379.1 phospholipase [Alteromonadaceae bacterium]MDG5499913.1 patatin-like phospholipase family protein [Marinobacter sp. BGYM27]|tara:strand:+ start:33425 stop:34888 length:1464 start_codon:yes stop_codon:yes gene_type:complete